MPIYEIIDDAGQWRILTHHTTHWSERSGPLPTEEEARRVVQGLTDTQGLEGEDNDA